MVLSGKDRIVDAESMGNQKTKRKYNKSETA